MFDQVFSRAGLYPYRFLIAAALLAAIFCLFPVQGDAPQQAQTPMSGQQLASAQTDLTAATPFPKVPGLPVGADLSERTQQNAMLHRTLYYAPCGHSVQRRQALPAGLIGLTRSALEKEIGGVIPGARITGFSAQEVDISLEAQMPCPLHWVLKSGENGKLQVLQNLTGEAMDIVRETDVEQRSLPEEAQVQMLEGMIFDDVQTLEGYLESLSS